MFVNKGWKLESPMKINNLPDCKDSVRSQNQNEAWLPTSVNYKHFLFCRSRIETILHAQHTSIPRFQNKAHVSEHKR